MIQWNRRNLLKSMIGAIMSPIKLGSGTAGKPVPPEPFDTVAHTRVPVVPDDDAFTIYEKLTLLIKPATD